VLEVSNRAPARRHHDEAAGVRPRIVQDEGQIGFHWAIPQGRPLGLPDLVPTDDEPTAWWRGPNKDAALQEHREADAGLVVAAVAARAVIFDSALLHVPGRRA